MDVSNNNWHWFTQFYKTDRWNLCVRLPIGPSALSILLCFPFSHIDIKKLQFYTFRGFNKVKLESYNWHLIKVFWHLRSVHFKAQCKVHFIQDIISESKLHLKLCKVQSTSNGKIALSRELFCKLQISAMSISIMAIEINSQECSL